MVNRRRQWLVQQILAGEIEAATSPDVRMADDDFCEAIGLEAHERRAKRLLSAAAYLTRVAALEAKFKLIDSRT
jgi:hypothetical protein